MRTRLNILPNLLLPSMLLGASIAAAGQLNIQVSPMPKMPVQRVSKPGLETATTTQGMNVGTAYSKRRQKESRRQIRIDSPGTVIPNWSDSFTYHGLLYNYTMAGTDPRAGSASTVVPTVLIPLRFVFADGHIYNVNTDTVDGQLPIPAILNSPVFQNHDYVIGGIDVGNTQYGDAFQRANFWNSVSTVSPDYHVLLGTPNVAALQTISVPNGYFGYRTDPATQQVLPVVDTQYLGSRLYEIMQNLNIGPQTLTIFETGIVSQFNSWGFHTVLDDGSGRTIIVAPFLPHDVAYYGQHVPDLFVLSHEVVEWIDDPFLVNFAPGWNFAGAPHAQCDYGNYLEVGDPFAFYDPGITPIQINSTTYHVTDAAFLDFFTRNASRSINGQYSFFASISGAPSPCVGEIAPDYTYFSYPGAINTFARGINNAGSVTGFYQNTDRKFHSYLYQNSTFTPLDFPGAVETSANGINDSGSIVGVFKDSQGLSHGFLYKNNQWSTINFPSALSTSALGINSTDTIVGSYENAAHATHGFIFRNGTFERVNTTKRTPNVQIFGINDSNKLAGVSSANVSTGPFRSYTGISRRLLNYSFPESDQTILFDVNNSNEMVGYFINPDGYFAPVITLLGYAYYGNTDFAPYTYPHGYNDSGKITGDFGDPNLDGSQGFIGLLPIATRLPQTLKGRSAAKTYRDMPDWFDAGVIK